MSTALNFLPIFLSLILIEYVVGRFKGRSLYSRTESGLSIGIALGQQLIRYLGLSLRAAMLFLLWEFKLFELPKDNIGYWVALFFSVEFTYYWFHRMSHEVRWFWANHSVHHSIEEMNILAAIRFGWTGWISGAFIFHAPLAIIGFHPVHIALMLGLNLAYQSWIHTTLIGKLPLIEGILNTPSAHRVHHASNADYLDRNHGGVTMIFDRVFGTYVEEREDTPVEFGLVKPAPSKNIFRVTLNEWIRMVADLRSSPIKHWPGYLFGPPGWAPDGQGITSKDLRDQYRLEHPNQVSPVKLDQSYT
ncbi:MAG: sterol desaturase family protein [Pseudomonadales bacterium]|nr:sterol desaturase family protein [Pseudomonadales bacterium]